MSTPLERLINEIETVPNELGRYTDRALNTFRGTPGIIEDLDEYSSVLGRFHIHLEETFYGIEIPNRDESDHFRLCTALLGKSFGRDAFHTCFEIARTGAEGGIRGILRTAADLYFTDKAENRVGGLVVEYLAKRNFEEKQADTDEYISKYERLIPGELREGSGTRIRINLQQVLQKHPFFLRQLRRRTG